MHDSVRSVYMFLYRDWISDLHIYILSDRMDIWYRDQFWVLSRIVRQGPHKHKQQIFLESQSSDYQVLGR